MSQMAHVLRSHGWVEIACSTLEWTIEHGAQDGHVLSEVAECHLARGDLKGAEAILERARAAGLATDAIYTSLVKAHGRRRVSWSARGGCSNARRRTGPLSAFTYPALIAAYGAAGDVAGASRIFECARADGQLSAPAFTALASALAGRGRHGSRRTRAPDGAAIGPYVCQARVHGDPCAFERAAVRRRAPAARRRET